MNIKERIFEYRRRKMPKQQAVFPKYEDVRSVLILYESDLSEKNTVVKAVREHLLTEDKDVVLWGYCDKKEIVSLVLPQSRILGRHDLNLLGAPKEDVIKDLQKRPYDLLIDLTQKPCLPLRYVSLYARAQFRAGLNIPGSQNDLLIQTAPQETPQFLFEQIEKYLKMIRTK
ncbi:MAG: hypothetical protein J5612_00450 [Paludibacteraceae bacterium]|nr:hypothetical protein [Paludibacteraceae bacterium]